MMGSFATVAWADVAPVIIVALGVGGPIGAVVLLLRVRPEAGQVTVKAAEGAVIVQTGVIESLREELARMSERLDEVENSREELRQRLTETDARKRDLQNQNVELSERVRHLETEVDSLRSELALYRNGSDTT